MKKYTSLLREMQGGNLTLVTESYNIRDLEWWRARLESEGAHVAVIRCAQNGGTNGPRRIFTLWTDSVGVSFFDRHARETELEVGSRGQWDAWGENCFHAMMGHDKKAVTND